MFCPVRGHPALLNKHIDSIKLSNWELGVPCRGRLPSLPYGLLPQQCTRCGHSFDIYIGTDALEGLLELLSSSTCANQLTCAI